MISGRKVVPITKDEVQESLDEVLALWNRMKTSAMDEAGDDADRFQMTFYVFTDRLKQWTHTLQTLPADAEEAREHPDFRPLFDALPQELQIPFETELDAVLEGRDRQSDDTEQS